MRAGCTVGSDPYRRIHYERRRAEESVLYKTLQHHLEPFIARVEQQSDRDLPYFIKKELRDFLGCGTLARGFLRVRCPDCRHDRVVAFSCKHRGFCPSCGGRRMAEKAAQLTDHVLPEVPMRQWVLSLPYKIRYRLAYDKDACTIALRAFIRTVFSDLRHLAKRHHGVAKGKPGGVTFIQRFASSLALNVHFHSILFDGVYTENDDGTLRFLPLPPPTDAEVVVLTKKVGRSVRRALERAGKCLDELDPEPDSLATDDPVLATLYGSSIVGRVATGTRAGHRVERLGDRVNVDDPDLVTSSRCARVLGFSLHADVGVPARDRKRLERLARYIARPPLATERLHRRSDGKLVCLFRKAWRDGTRGVVFTPDEFIEKLVALIPPPQANLLQYHGVLAPGSKLRSRVVADRRSPTPAGAQAVVVPLIKAPVAVQGRPASSLGKALDDAIAGLEATPRRGVSGTLGASAVDRGATKTSGENTPSSATPTLPDHGSRRRRIPWAELMKRVFAIDVLQCPKCGGAMKIIAEITDPKVIKRFLAALDLPTEAPRVERARPPPQMDFGWPDETNCVLEA